MCRMFSYVGNSEKELNELYGALSKSAEDDPLLKKFHEDNRHKDGWGYVILADSGIFHYRSGKPIFEDGHELPELRGEMYAIFHARKRSPNSPEAASVFSHPFFAVTGSKLEFLSHNGALEGTYANMVDSEHVLDLIVENGAEQGVEQAKRITRTALNLFILEIDRATTKPSMKYLNFDKAKDENVKEYYRLYRRKTKEGTSVFSSTLSKYGITHAEKAEYGVLVDLKREEP